MPVQKPLPLSPCPSFAKGLAALGTADDEALEDLKNTLYTDDAVAGEARGRLEIEEGGFAFVGYGGSDPGRTAPHRM